ncbi:DUF488 family protein [Rhodoplanes roseus]|uniref:DUF488 domain-containing protein n=1 Tax=Rhodoplanes roseus TaxID=29409 RepID=A0A327KN62_9BRAD|nr:DUF488 family protein [Rhodoplanes roseus]RAI40330.1 hypothetical protein CH341_23970 [Rhodoplanes roseus]
MTNVDILTIGHSSSTFEEFLDRLRGAGATAVADVRSAPYSRRHPQFDRAPLRAYTLAQSTTSCS